MKVIRRPAIVPIPVVMIRPIIVVVTQVVLPAMIVLMMIQVPIIPVPVGMNHPYFREASRPDNHRVQEVMIIEHAGYLCIIVCFLDGVK